MCRINAALREIRQRYVKFFPLMSKSLRWFTKRIAKYTGIAIALLKKALMLEEKRYAGTNKARTIFGVQIGLHYRWLIIALRVTYSLAGQMGATTPHWGADVSEKFTMSNRTALVIAEEHGYTKIVDLLKEWCRELPASARSARHRDHSGASPGK